MIEMRSSYAATYILWVRRRHPVLILRTVLDLLQFETIGSKNAADRPYKLLRCDLLGGQPLSEAS